MITWDSTNMLKRISSSPVFYRTLFVKDVGGLHIDRPPYHPKTTLESNAAGDFLPDTMQPFFDFFRAFSQVTLRKNHKNDNKHK